MMSVGPFFIEILALILTVMGIIKKQLFFNGVLRK